MCVLKICLVELGDVGRKEVEVVGRYHTCACVVLPNSSSTLFYNPPTQQPLHFLFLFLSIFFPSPNSKKSKLSAINRAITHSDRSFTCSLDLTTQTPPASPEY